MANTPTPGLANAELIKDSGDMEAEQTGNIPSESAAVVVGKNKYTPVETENILAKMQQYVDERESPFAKFASGLSAGVATARGPAALAAYQRQKLEEEKQTMDYRQQMAQLTSAPELARQRNLSMAQMLASLKGEGAAGIGGAPSGLDSNVLNRVAQLFPTDEEKANQLLNSHLLETSKINRTAALNKDFYSPDIQIAAPTPENPNGTKFVSVADLQGMSVMPRLTAQGQATLAQKNAVGAAQPSAAQPSAAQPSAAQPSAAQPSNYLTTPAAQAANKLGKTTGDFTDQELDNLRTKESSSNPYALNKNSKAMGAYQFTPETVIDLHKRGIKFDPLDEKQSREVARNELNRLTKELGSKELALSSYGGHLQADPTNYINSIIKPSETTTTGTDLIKPIQAPSQTPLTPPSIGLSPEQKAGGEKAKVAAGEAAKTAEAERKEFKTNINPDTIVETDAMAKRVQTLVKEYPEISGVINKNDYASAVAGVLKEGIGPASIKGLETAIFKTLPNTGKESLSARNELAGYLAKIELQAAKLIKGQGQITEGEREILQRASASLDDPAELLYKKARIIERANKKNEELASIYGAGEKFADFEKFHQDDNFKRIMSKYKTDLNNIMNEKVDFRKLKIGAQSGKIEHPSDIQDIINRTQKPKKAE
jgi:hypothetical protein